MSELYRISIAPIIVRLKLYIETAQENLGKDLEEQSVRADLLAERQNLRKAISLLEKYNDKWEAVFLRIKGQVLIDEQVAYREFQPEGKPFMSWTDQARGLVDTIEGALGLSEIGDGGPIPQPPTQSNVNQQVSYPRHDVTLPPITLPKFSGESREWPLFWKLFESSVESLQIEDFKKHIYLLGCLPERSIARRAIDLYPPSDENYPRVVDILKKRFGDEKTMIESLQAELLHLPKPTDSTQSLRTFSEAVERLCHQLLDFGENEQNKFMASTIKSKLPFNLLTQVIEKEMASGGTFSCSDLRQAITSIVEVKEEVQRCAQIFRGEEKAKAFLSPSPNQGRNFPVKVMNSRFPTSLNQDTHGDPTREVKAKDTPRAGVQSTQLQEPEENGSLSNKDVLIAFKPAIILSNVRHRENAVYVEKLTTL
uniref:Gag protein n=1 Tax=Globodera rostochiensis TaxID=31243 RepID=A0A914HMN6_GLORO